MLPVNVATGAPPMNSAHRHVRKLAFFEIPNDLGPFVKSCTP
jgi:hypothetical protein